MLTVTILKGLPASGKSTWAKEEVERLNKKTVRVNKDELRAMMGGFDKVSEKIVLAVRNEFIRESLLNGKSVIVDDTNLNPKHEHDIAMLTYMTHPTAKVIIKEFDTDVNECIKRDALRANPVGAKVIREMSEQYSFGIPKPEFEPVVQDINLPWTIIVDIDGTIAHMNGRSPYDYSKVDTDTYDKSITYIVQMLSKDCEIVFVSWRKEECRIETLNWLRKWVLQDITLYMRKSDDNRCDSIVKREILEELIKTRYIVAALDDRNRVVKMWRESGIKCLQVAEGNF